MLCMLSKLIGRLSILFIHHLIQLRSIDFCANYLLLPHLRHFAFRFIRTLAECVAFKTDDCYCYYTSFNMLRRPLLLRIHSHHTLAHALSLTHTHNEAQTNWKHNFYTFISYLYLYYFTQFVYCSELKPQFANSNQMQRQWQTSNQYKYCIHGQCVVCCAVLCYGMELVCAFVCT